MSELFYNTKSNLEYYVEDSIHYIKSLVGYKQQEIVCKNCNIILISIDTLSADHLPCYGYSKDTAPNICKLAKKGFLFENFIVHSYLTPISQMSIFTSQYPSVNGIISFFSELSPTKKTLPILLKAHGYKTASFSSSLEFARFNMMGGDKVVNFFPNFEKGFDQYEYIGSRDLPWDAFFWLQNNKNEKFFLWIPIGTVHWPYGRWVPPELKGKFSQKGYDGTFKGKEYFNYDTLSHIFKNKFYPDNISKKALELKSNDIDYVISHYDAGIYYTDIYIKELLKELDKLDLVKDTLIILHGVHGEDLGEHGYFAHYDIYDTEVKNVLIIYNPKQRTKKRIREQVRGIDLMPTILNLVGISYSNETQGQSLIPLLQGKEGTIPEKAYIERIPLWEEGALRYNSTYSPIEYQVILDRLFENSIDKYPSYKDTALRTNEWKLIHRKSREIEEKASWWGYLINKTIKREEFELYNLKEDPYEQKNVIKEYPYIAQILKKDLLSWENEVYLNSK